MMVVHAYCIGMMTVTGSIGSVYDRVLLVAGALLVALVGIVLVIIGPLLVYWVLTLPLRRQERARMFVHVLESAMAQGRSIEQAIVSLARTEEAAPTNPFTLGLLRRRHFGPAFGRLAVWLEAGMPLHEALDLCPGIVPTQVTETLRSGAAIGRVDRVLPACHTILSSATSRMRGALNYVAVIGTGFVFVSSAMLMAILVLIVPKFRAMFLDMRMPMSPAFEWLFMSDGGVVLVRLTWGFGLALLVLALVYMAGPRLLRLFPGLRGLADRLAMLLPWRRKRLQRDFSTMLAIILDADLPEAEAIEMAGRSTGNRVFARRATAVAGALDAGDPLPDALGRLGGGELRWHLANALHQKTGFLDALRGWHDLLEAKAFQQEQVGAQIVTTTFMLVTGLVVALFAVGIFESLVRLVKETAVW